MRFGSFYVGGRDIEISGRPRRRVRQTDTITIETDPNGTYRVEAAYVQWFRPTGGGPKIVLQHGGGLSGTMWEATPDGRPGWAQNLLARGFEVYVVDNVERGRAGWCPFPDVWEGEPLLRSAEEAWGLFRIGAPGDFAAREPFAGQLFPTEHFGALLPFQVPRWPRGTDLAVDALGAVLRRVGPCALVGHSQGGEIAIRAAARHPDLVRDLVLVEPSGWAEGALGASFRHVRSLFLIGDFLQRQAVFRTLEPLWAGWVEELHGLGATAELRRLPGNSHVPMMDRNSAQIAAQVADWLRNGDSQRGPGR